MNNQIINLTIQGSAALASTANTAEADLMLANERALNKKVISDLEHQLARSCTKRKFTSSKSFRNKKMKI